MQYRYKSNVDPTTLRSYTALPLYSVEILHRWLVCLCCLGKLSVQQAKSKQCWRKWSLCVASHWNTILRWGLADNREGEVGEQLELKCLFVDSGLMRLQSSRFLCRPLKYRRVWVILHDPASAPCHHPAESDSELSVSGFLSVASHSCEEDEGRDTPLLSSLRHPGALRGATGMSGEGNHGNPPAQYNGVKKHRWDIFCLWCHACLLVQMKSRRPAEKDKDWQVECSSVMLLLFARPPVRLLPQLIEGFYSRWKDGRDFLVCQSGDRLQTSIGNKIGR